MLAMNEKWIWWRRCKTLGIYLSLVSFFASLPSAPMVCTASLLRKTSFSCTGEYIASQVMRNMKGEIDPCDNFYQFACGNFMDKTRIPRGRGYVDEFTRIRDLFKIQLADIVTAELHERMPKYFRFPHYLYKACMDTRLIENLGARPIREISDTLGGWPVIRGNSWNSDNSWSWQELVKKLRRLGFGTGYIFKFSVNADNTKTTRPIINLDRPDLVNEPKFYNENKEKYFNYTVDIAELFGARRIDATKELREAVEFEVDLAHITWRAETYNNRLGSHNLLTIKQLQESYPYVDWLNLINGLLPDNIEVDETEIVNLSAPIFFEKLGKLMQSTDKRVIANYMMWYIHAFSVRFLSNEFRLKYYRFSSAAEGGREVFGTQNQCLELVFVNLPILVGSMYIRRHRTEKAKVSARRLVKYIWRAFNELLDEAQWMDDNTKKEAKRKLDLIKVSIGFPDELMNYYILEEYYSKLEIDPNRFFQSYLNIKAFQMDYSDGKLMTMMQSNWVEDFQLEETDVTYYEEENRIELPAAILQKRFFKDYSPKYMNYGALGSVVGHEIVHGVGGEGREYDAEGNLVNWWQSSTEKAYFEKAKCMIEQYGSYVNNQTGLKVNGFRTLEENIADNGGVKVAYRAYKNWLAVHGEERSLPGLHYNSLQMFWISFAQAHCAKYRTGYLNLLISDDEHSPNEFRVLGPLRNMKEFAQDFQCPENSPMNPLQKCEVW